ncbi:MAG: hypothetical protein HY649_12110 [Acidobacteria bacterium]|nr:hypothetical protein [Acidobacteriota bacterium]
MPGYLFLVVLFLALLSVSFFFAAREWLRPADDAPLAVDIEYVRQENYFGLCFRASFAEWLASRSVPATDSVLLPLHAMAGIPNGQPIPVLEKEFVGEEEQCQEIVYSATDLRLGSRAVCRKEVYCRGNFWSESGAQLHAVAADGAADLGAGAFVSGWVDAQASVRLQQATTVHGRVTSLESIELAREVMVQHLCAPLIFTSGYQPSSDSFNGLQPKAQLHPHSVGQDTADTLPPPYLHALPCVRLAADTWMVRGPLHLPAGTEVRGKLVVQGALSTESDCCFASDVKASEVRLGPRNKVLGNLVSAGGLQIAEAGVVLKNVVADGDIVLRSGARVGDLRRLAVVSAGGQVRLEQDVAVHGKVIAGHAIFSL